MPIGKARLRVSEYNEKRKASVAGQERNVRMVSLSLTSMVDMFAILVIFLLTNSDGGTQWVDLGHGINLPKSSYNAPPPAKGATVQISPEGVFADTTTIMPSPDVLSGPEINPVFKTWLAGQKSPAEQDFYFNIVSDEHVAFGIIRKLISTAYEVGYTKVNLAIQPK